MLTLTDAEKRILRDFLASRGIILRKDDFEAHCEALIQLPPNNVLRVAERIVAQGYRER